MPTAGNSTKGAQQRLITITTCKQQGSDYINSKIKTYTVETYSKSAVNPFLLKIQLKVNSANNTKVSQRHQMLSLFHQTGTKIKLLSLYTKHGLRP